MARTAIVGRRGCIRFCGIAAWAGLAAGALAAEPAAQTPAAREQLFELAFEDLMKVVVSASSRAQPLREAPATLHVITAEQIAARGYRTLEDALLDLPGIDAVHVGGAFPTIFAPRGAWGDENRRILLLIDGIVENSLNGAFELGGPAYGLYGVDRVEVMFGPASALFGANAFSGIINLITRAAGDTPRFDYRRAFGRFDSVRDDLYYTARPATNWTLSIAGTRLRTDGPRLERVIAGYSDGYVDDAIGWNLRLRHAGDAGSTVVGAHGTDTPMGNGTFGNTPTAFLGLPPRAVDNPGLGGFYHADLGGEPPGRWHPYTQTVFAEHLRQRDERWQAMARLSYRETGLRDDTYSYALNRAGTALSRFHGTYHSYSAGGELRVSYVPDPDRSLTVGAQYYRNNLEAGYRTVQPDPTIVIVDGIALTNLHAVFNPRAAVRTHDVGVYVEHQQRTQWLRDTSFTLGARYDRNSLYGESFNPRIGLVNHPAAQWTLKLLYGRAYRAPTPFELYSASPVRIASPDLRPERVQTWEFALAHDGPAHLLQGTLFHNRLRDVIVEGIPVGAGQTQIQNAARAQVTGVTAGWDYRPTAGWKLYANATWQHAEQRDRNGRFRMPNVARWKANAGVQFALAACADLHAAARWVGDRTVVPTHPRDEVDGYLLLDAHLASKPLWNGRVVLSASVRNLTDRRYVDPGIRRADGGTFAPELEQPGRTWWLGVELRL